MTAIRYTDGYEVRPCTKIPNLKNREKDTVEDSIRDNLRGFSRTIPSFLMAYGDDSVTLENFDKVIPDHVFKEVTRIISDRSMRLFMQRRVLSAKNLMKCSGK